jgi:Spy/CpxP family protein refolding chaperone
MRIALGAGILILSSVAGFAQTPYAGMQTRPIKALSEPQVADLQAGRGMGLALAAELNGYPGPSHVLELADKLGLSADQREATQQLFNAMKQEALPIGAKLISQEAELDRQFAGRTVTPASLKTATSAIAVTQGELREAHLKYHLSTLTLLTENQRQKYSELRGYGGQGFGEHGPEQGAGQRHHHN